ncbi:MAG: hypothetical protein K5655_05780 [Lachnospiraceae bacterium]|nr:hypothetical protein [Lachnospiraceae bacterium]
MKNVGMIVDEGICTGCCECLGACDSNSIVMIYSIELGRPVPCISEDCSGCGECVDACDSRELLKVQNM